MLTYVRRQLLVTLEGRRRLTSMLMLLSRSYEVRDAFGRVMMGPLDLVGYDTSVQYFGLQKP